MKKKIIALALAVAMFAAVAITSSFAYLQDTSEIAHNTFTVGNVQISLEETKVDVYGEAIVGAAPVLANEYKLIPNHTYVKDPTVTVEEGSEECYVRMIVTITDYADVLAVLGTGEGDARTFNFNNFVTGLNANWVQNGTAIVDVDGDTITYEFRYNTTVNTLVGGASELPALFTGFKMPGAVSAGNLALLKNMEINVVAHAIQADGFADAPAAWADWTVTPVTVPVQGN